MQASHVPEGRRNSELFNLPYLCFHVCNVPVNFCRQVALSFQTEVPSTSLWDVDSVLYRWSLWRQHRPRQVLCFGLAHHKLCGKFQVRIELFCLPSYLHVFRLTGNKAITDSISSPVNMGNGNLLILKPIPSTVVSKSLTLHASSSVSLQMWQGYHLLLTNLRKYMIWQSTVCAANLLSGNSLFLV